MFYPLVSWQSSELGKTIRPENHNGWRGSLGGIAEKKRSRRRLVLYSVPFLALALLFGIYYIATVSPSPAEDFTIPIAIQLVQLYYGSAYLSNVLPKYVGASGGLWYTHQYDSYGLNGHYPVFAQEAPSGSLNYSIIHVRSRVIWNYTLQDFFNVWGEPIGIKNTLGYTTPPAASQNSTTVRYGSDWYWDMCVRYNGGGWVGGLWGNQTLVPGLQIVLRYSNDGCRSVA